MEQCIELFAIFGGYNEPIDTNEPIESLIIRHIITPFESHRENLLSPLNDDPLYLNLLHAVAVGDRRQGSAYRRARIGKERGNVAFEFLRLSGYLTLERSREMPLERAHPKQRFKKEIEHHRISHKFRFTSPFLRFWFAFVEPFSKSIREGNYQPFLDHFREQFNAFVGFTFEELCDLYIREILAPKFGSDILDSGSYWNREVEIDLFIETMEGEIWVGECKWTNHKVNKKEFHKLEEKSTKLSIIPDKILLFTKRGFSNELSDLKDKRLYRFNAEDLNPLTNRL
jgi:AAA+ ATPase superfamily predicted ATPase